MAQIDDTIIFITRTRVIFLASVTGLAYEPMQVNSYRQLQHNIGVRSLDGRAGSDEHQLFLAVNTRW